MCWPSRAHFTCMCEWRCCHGWMAVIGMVESMSLLEQRGQCQFNDAVAGAARWQRSHSDHQTGQNRPLPQAAVMAIQSGYLARLSGLLSSGACPAVMTIWFTHIHSICYLQSMRFIPVVACTDFNRQRYTQGCGLLHGLFHEGGHAINQMRGCLDNQLIMHLQNNGSLG